MRRNFIQKEGEYSVSDLGGKVRSRRAPEDIITRAVAFTAQIVIHFIYIGQEYIDQEDPADKRARNTSNVLYHRAFSSSISFGRTCSSSYQVLEQSSRHQDLPQIL
ncbi:hypothetical protein WAI453_005369 [Rhynchosporium graminicola]